MRAIAYNQFGRPDEVLTVVDRPEVSPGPGQIRIRVNLASVHNHDYVTVLGRYGYRPELPAIGGSEAVGVIDATGDGAKLAVGQRVGFLNQSGTWAEQVVVSEAAATPIPETIPDEIATQLLSMPVSALALLNSLRLAEGDWVVQNAANGAVGVTLAKLAQARKLNVLNIVRRPTAIGELAAIGITNTISSEDADWKNHAKALVGDARIASAIDSIGGKAANDLADLLSADGELVIFGSLTGQPLELNGGQLLFKELNVRGFWASRLMQRITPGQRAELYRDVLGFAASGDLVLPVGGIFKFEDVTAAMVAHGTAGRGGKILLRP
ncbi:zinc-binding dehydrogenase [Paraburkholderia silviterrae]|uniref:enoyl-[acyl-carrier-protein] reductase n=1 Tax=Paraburkholderia silviterrae TaxID=2528715 RepID=A0A4R5M0X9_9BURK|nr:zinc-binding dehydrogenase [Paraburkholderia silviterrae]TDG18857.1 alcohol dehydrogenase [Paraburkholderia silviterrae]